MLASAHDLHLHTADGLRTMASCTWKTHIFPVCCFGMSSKPRIRAGVMSSTASRVRGTPVPKLPELIDEEDDWSGMTDAASRRRIQNRLNVRAYRRRKVLELKSKATRDTGESQLIKTESEIPCWVEAQQATRLVPATTAAKTNNLQAPLIPRIPSSQDSIIPAGSPKPRIMFPLSSDHLIVLLQFNVLRASLANRELVSQLGSAPTAECSSAAEHVLPYPTNPGIVPPSLLPTTLQRTVPHEGWVDIIPHPVWRDNVLLALGQFDEDALWSDIMGGLFEGFPESEIEHRGVIAWSPPWDASGWELSPGFAKKWGWCLRGCEDILAITNQWRLKRGDEPIVYELP